MSTNTDRNILILRVFQGDNDNDWVVIGKKPCFTPAGKIDTIKTVYLHQDGTWRNTALDKDSSGHFSSKSAAEEALQKYQFPTATQTEMEMAFAKLRL